MRHPDSSVAIGAYPVPFAHRMYAETNSIPPTSRGVRLESNSKLTIHRLGVNFRKGDGVRPQPRLLMGTVSRC